MNKRIGFRFLITVKLMLLGGCVPTVTDSGYLGEFSRMSIDHQRQQAATGSPTQRFQALVYGLVADRMDIVSQALQAGADPNGGVNLELIAQSRLMIGEQSSKGQAADAAWRGVHPTNSIGYAVAGMDFVTYNPYENHVGSPLDEYESILGVWCNETQKANGQCIASAPSMSDLSSSSPLFPVFTLVRSPEAVDFLLENGAKVDRKLLNGTFHMAAHHGDVALMRRLAELGAEMDALGVDGWRPMHRAALFGRADAIAWLLEQGLDPNTGGAAVDYAEAPNGGRIYRSPGIGQLGVTPLHLIAAHGTRGMKVDRNGIKPLIKSVVPGGPADQAGLQAGDLIVAINDRPVLSWDEFESIVGKSAGVPLKVRLERQGVLYETTFVPEASSSGVSPGNSIGMAWAFPDMWRPDWQAFYQYDPGYKEALERLIAAGAYVDARATYWLMPNWWWVDTYKATDDQTPLHVAYDKNSFEIVQELVENGADQDARLASGETPKEAAGKVLLEAYTESWKQEQAAKKTAAIKRQRDQQAANSGMNFGQMIALGGAAAVTAYGAGQGMGAEALTVGAGMAADIMTNGEAGGVNKARQALQEYAQIRQQPTSGGAQPVPAGTSSPPQPQGCENTLTIGSAKHSFLPISLPSGVQVPVGATLVAAQGGRAIRLESMQATGNASRIVAQVLIPDRYQTPGNIPMIDDNAVPGLESGAVGTLDIYRGREYANFRTNFDYGRNQNMGSVNLSEAGQTVRGTFSFQAVEDGYPRRGTEYTADVSGRFCVTR